MPKVELLPVTYDPEAFLMWADENFRRIADTIGSLKASDIGAGIFPGAISFADTVAVTGIITLSGRLRVLAAAGRAYFWDGLELAQVSSTPYIDFHRSADPEEATDYNVRLMNDADGYLTLFANNGVPVIRSLEVLDFVDSIRDNKVDLYNGTYLIGVRSSELYMKSGGNKFSWETPPGTWAMRYGPVEVQGGLGLAVNGGLAVTDWIRSTGNNGWYHQTHGGGIFMDMSTWVKVYGTKPLYSRKAGSDWSDHALIAVENTGGAVGVALYNENVTAMCLSIGYGVASIRVVNYNEGAWASITASAFNVGSTRAEKHDIQSLTHGQKVKQMRPVRFKRQRLTICIRCDGKGRTSTADWVRRVDHYDPPEDSPPQHFQEIDCPTCSTSGIPGQLNSPAIDKTEDTDFLGFIAEEVAEYAPEAIFWGPADRDNVQSKAVPMAIDVMAMVALIATEIKELDIRLDKLEGKSGK